MQRNSIWFDDCENIKDEIDLEKAKKDLVYFAEKFFNPSVKFTEYQLKMLAKIGCAENPNSVSIFRRKRF